MVELDQDDRVERIAKLSRRAAVQAARGPGEVQRRQRFLARLDAELLSPRRSWGLLAWLLPGTAICIAAVALLLLRDRALTFTASGAELSGQYVSAPASASATLLFSDASSVVVTPGSRLRIEDTNAHGARVLLERGQASVRVMHTGSTAWTFAAGPFEVRVTGTRFDLSWDPAHDRCELALREGSVEVRGPGGSGPVVLRSGQRFRGDAQGHTMQVLELDAAAPNPSEPGVVASARSNAVGPEPSAVAEPSGSPVPDAPTDTAPESSARLKPRLASWSQAIAQGKFKAIVRDAEARGISGCLASCSFPDLRALSDAARYTGESALAERTLMALRQRFPGAPASDAAFSLARLYEKRGAPGVALTWYDSYLREAPSGPFAAEALAGKLRAVRATQGKQAAEPIAREYLARFPKGVHVNAAREILEPK